MMCSQKVRMCKNVFGHKEAVFFFFLYQARKSKMWSYDHTLSCAVLQVANFMQTDFLPSPNKLGDLTKPGLIVFALEEASALQFNSASPRSWCKFPVAAVTNCLNLCGLKQHKFIVSWIWRSEIWGTVIFLETSRDNLFFFLPGFWRSPAFCSSWLRHFDL